MCSSVEATGVQYGSVAFVNPGTQTKLESLQNRLDQLNKKLSQINDKENELLNNDDFDIEHLDKELKKYQNVRQTLTNIIKEAEDEIEVFKGKNKAKENLKEFLKYKVNNNKETYDNKNNYIINSNKENIKHDTLINNSNNNKHDILTIKNNQNIKYDILTKNKNKNNKDDILIKINNENIQHGILTNNSYDNKYHMLINNNNNIKQDMLTNDNENIEYDILTNNNLSTVKYMYNKNQVLNNTSKITKNKNITITINNIKYVPVKRKKQHKYDKSKNMENLILADTHSLIHITNKRKWLKNYRTIKNAIIKRIFKNTINKNIQNFDMYSNNVIEMYNVIKEHFLDMFPRKVKDEMWKRIKIDQFCSDRYKYKKVIQKMQLLEVWSFRDTDPE